MMQISFCSFVFLVQVYSHVYVHITAVHASTQHSSTTVCHRMCEKGKVLQAYYCLLLLQLL